MIFDIFNVLCAEKCLLRTVTLTATAFCRASLIGQNFIKRN